MFLEHLKSGKPALLKNRPCPVRCHAGPSMAQWLSHGVNKSMPAQDLVRFLSRLWLISRFFTPCHPLILSPLRVSAKKEISYQLTMLNYNAGAGMYENLSPTSLRHCLALLYDILRYRRISHLLHGIPAYNPLFLKVWRPNCRLFASLSQGNSLRCFYHLRRPVACCRQCQCVA